MIRLIEVKGYKCLRYIRQPLQPFHILVGPNASGKSTFLDVVLFVRDLIDRDLEQAIRKRARTFHEMVWKGEDHTIEIAFEFEIAKELQSQRNGHLYSKIRYEVRIGTDDNGELQILVENLWLVSEMHGRKESLVPQQRESFPAEPRPPATIVVEPGRHSPYGWRKVMSRTREGRVYMRSERTNWNMQLKPLRGRSGLTIIPEDEDSFPATVWLRRLLTENVHFLMLDSRSMREPVPPDAPRAFQPTGVNLARVVEVLQQENRKNFERWFLHLKTVLNDLELLKVEELPENRFRYLVATFANNARIPSWLLSDGALRVMALTLLPYLPNPPAIYFVEEPENGVHPKALEAIYQSLSTVYGGQVLCATHSPIFLNLAKPEEILCFGKTGSGESDIVRGDQHPKLKEWRKEVSLGDLLASGVLE